MLACSRRVREQGRESSTDEDVAIADAFDSSIALLGSGEDRPANRTVDWRLRQVVLPKNGAYVATTPLAAAGISGRIFAQRERLPGSEIVLPVGGTKPRIVTAIYSATRSLVRDVPSVSYGGVSLYLRILHRGYSFAPMSKNKSFMEAMDHYGNWLAQNEFVSGESGRNSVKAAEIETRSSGIFRIVSMVLGGIQEASNDIQDYLDSLDESERDTQMSALCGKGAIETAIATGRFSHEFVDAIAGRIVQMIDGRKFTVSAPAGANPSGKQKVSIMLGRNGRERVKRVTVSLVSEFIARGK